jgi:hypothetical protein
LLETVLSHTDGNRFAPQLCSASIAIRCARRSRISALCYRVDIDREAPWIDGPRR